MRPRKHDTGLPSGVYYKNGGYYKVIKGVWYLLGRTRLDMERHLDSVTQRIPPSRQELLGFCYKVFTRAKQNAKGRRGKEFTLENSDVLEMLNECGWKCAVTGIEFTFEMVSGKMPFSPSIDRIDNSKGYIKGNCRIVCVAANYAMNVWGEEVLRRLIRSHRKTAKAA